MPPQKLEGKINQDPFEVDLRDKLAREIGAGYIGCFDDNGLAIAVTGKNFEQKYFINKAGKIIAGPYQHVKPFKEDLAKVKREGKQYFINRKGEEVIGPIDGFIRDFDKGLASISIGSYTHFINKKGEKVDNKEYPKQYKQPVADKAPVAWPISEMRRDRFYIIDKVGKEIAGPFDRVKDFSEGLALVNIRKEGENYGENYFINKKGKIVLGPYNGYNAFSFNEGVAVVFDENRKPYYIDHAGKKVFTKNLK